MVIRSFIRRLRSLRVLLSAALLLQLLVVLMGGCERRPLEVIVDERVRVRIIVKWRVNFVELYGTTPNGMTVMIWGSRGGAPLIRTTNDDNITVQLEPDTYRMVIFNELADDYRPWMRFVDDADYDRIAMRATTFTVSSRRAWGDGEYMYAPEDPRIAVALDTFDITPEMVMSDTTIFLPYEQYRDQGFVNYHESEMVYEIPEVPWPMTVDLYVRLRVKHRQSLKGVEGFISGMADGFYLSHIIRTSETGTLRFSADSWERTRLGEEADSLGMLTTRVASFGLPYGKELLEQCDSADNILNLGFLLANDSMVYRQFKVGKDIKYITPEGREAQIRYRQDLQNLELIVVLPEVIDLPNVTTAEGAGFDARVDDWEEGGIWDLGGF